MTGLAKCDCCYTGEGERTGMMLRTGKSGQYRYLACANRATKATFACSAPQIRMETIDALVLSEVETHVLKPQRIKVLIGELLQRRNAGRHETEAELPRQKDALKKAESGLRNLYAAIADAPDMIKPDDPIYREQLALLNRQRAELSASIPVLHERLRHGPAELSDEKITSFSRGVQDRLRSSDPAFRRQWRHLFVDEVVISRDEIVISGRNDTLLKGVSDRPSFFGPVAPSFDREWRTRHDSNV